MTETAIMSASELRALADKLAAEAPGYADSADRHHVAALSVQMRMGAGVMDKLDQICEKVGRIEAVLHGGR